MATNPPVSEWRGGPGPAVTRTVMARVVCWITVALLGLFAVTARAASDWIDELPTVTAVAHAVTEQLKVDTANWNFAARGIALEDDDDLFAVYMVGTFVHLRKIILFKYQEEKSLSPERTAKLKSVVAAYLEAELFIGQGVGQGMRRGYLTTAQKCNDIACYRRWFKTGYSNVYISASYRGRILSRLFCGDRAAELDRLAQSYAGRTPYLPSPAETFAIDPEVAGLAPAGCSVYGGDANHNGLCDDWQNPPRITAGSNASISACGAIARPNQPVFSGGTREADNPWVEVRTGVTGQQGGECLTKDAKVKDCDGNVQTYQVPITGGCGILKNGISIRVKCASGHVVQFISREYWKRGVRDSQTPDQNLESGWYGAAPYNPEKDSDVVDQTCYEKTGDLKNRMWRTDSRKKPDPYYESGGAYATSCDSMTTLDAPNISSFDPQQYLVVRIVGKSFAICECKVVSVVDWQREYDAGSPGQPFYKVSPPRAPLLGEVEEFQARSREEGFNRWPFPEEQCVKCDR